MNTIITFMRGIFTALLDANNKSRIKYQNQLKAMQLQEQQCQLLQIQLQLRQEFADVLAQLPPYNHMVRIYKPDHLGLDRIVSCTNGKTLFCYRWNTTEAFHSDFMLSDLISQLNLDVLSQRQYFFTLLNIYPDMQQVYPLLTKGFQISAFRNQKNFIIIGLSIAQ